MKVKTSSSGPKVTFVMTGEATAARVTKVRIRANMAVQDSREEVGCAEAGAGSGGLEHDKGRIYMAMKFSVPWRVLWMGKAAA